MKNATLVAAAALLALAGTAHCQLQVNGRLKPQYGPAVWFNSTPTGFGDSTTEFPPPNPCTCTPVGQSLRVALDNTNRGGVTGAAADPVAVAAVTTGYEIQLDLADLGIPDSGPAPASIQIAGFISSGNLLFMSNQVIGGLPPATANLAESRNVNFANIAGDQFVTVPVGGSFAGTLPTVDGTLDASFYGSGLFFQANPTGFGDASGSGTLYTANGGSEIDNVYARIVTVNGVRRLYLFIGGNLEGNFNKLMLFFSTGAAGGQNIITSDGCTGFGIFDPVTRLGPCTTCTPTPFPGLTFDAGFAANYYIQLRTGNNNQFADFGRLAASAADRGWSRNISQTAQNTNPGAPVTAGSVAGVDNVLVSAANPCPPSSPTPATDYAAGSEINGIYTAVCTEGGQQFLYVLVTGNIQNNGNRLDLFFDAGTANIGTRDVPNIPSVGQNRLTETNARVDNGGLNRYGQFVRQDNTVEPGLRFSTSFNADYWLSIRNNGDSQPELGAWAARINTGGAVNDGNTPLANLFEFASFRFAPKAFPTPLVFDGLGCIRDGTTITACSTPVNGCAPNGAGTVFNPTSIIGIDVQGDLLANNALSNCVIPEPFSSYAPRLISRNVFDPLGTQSGNTNLAIPGLLTVNLDNSNRLGVTGSGDTNAAQSAALAKRVTSGVEVKVRLDELGWDGVSPIRIAGWITSGTHDFLSNQVIGNTDPALANLGSPSNVDFQAGALAAGTFYVTVVSGNCADAPTAACCFDTSTACSVMSQAQCSAAGGSWTPSQSACTALSCSIVQPANVVCCRGATCAVIPQAQCTLSGPASGTQAVARPSLSSCTGVSTTFAGCCYADYDKNGQRTIDDIFIYLNGWFANSPYTKVGGDGSQTRTIDDIFLFLNAWFAGCN